MTDPAAEASATIRASSERYCRGRREIIDGWSTGQWMPDCLRCARFTPTGLHEYPRWMWLHPAPMFAADCPNRIDQDPACAYP